MAYTNAQLVRREIGDGGIFLKHVTSGDGSSTKFYLPASAVILGSEIVTVGGTAKTGGGVDYTLDPESGFLTFTAAPALGGENIVVHYRGVEVSDGDITEALRQVGLVDTDTAAIGPTAAVLSAGYLLASWVAAKYAYDYDSSIDGQSLSRSQRAKQWQERADDLHERATRLYGILNSPTIRIDGYNRDEISTQAVGEAAVNVRQRYYVVGGVDDLP